MAKQKNLKERLAARRKTLSEKGKGDFHFMKSPGTYRFRIMPTGDSEMDWAAEVTQFYLGKKAILSPVSINKPCAVMELSNKLKNSKKESDKDMAAKVRPKKKYVVVALRYEDEKGKEVHQDGVRLLNLTTGAYMEAIDLYTDEDEAGDFTDPLNGFDIKITRTGTGPTDTSYTIRACKPSPLPKEYRKKTYNPEEMVEKLLPTYEETQEAVNEFLNGSEEDDETPKSKDKKAKKKKKKRSSDS